MSKVLPSFAALIAFVATVSPVRSQNPPAKVSACDLAKNPKAYDGKTIRVRGTLNVHFEDFTLAPGCETQQGIWLAFGGDVPGIVASLVNDNVRKPGTKFELNGVSYEIRKDDNFHKMYALIAARHGDKPDYRVTATLRGAFFAGEEIESAGGVKRFGGYGHIGCCALFVITQVLDVASVPSPSLRLRGRVLGPDGMPAQGLAVINDVPGGYPPERQQVFTNNKGEFTFNNSGQQLRIEDPRYRPIALTAEPGGASVIVKLQDARQSDWIVPDCGQERAPTNRIGFSVLFALPDTMDSSPFNSEDGPSYFVFPRGSDSAEARLILSNSREETSEAPDSLNADWFEQRWIKDGAGNIVGIDSKEQLKRGGYRRTAVFHAHDSADYDLRPEESTVPLDQIIDSACIPKR